MSNKSDPGIMSQINQLKEEKERLFAAAQMQDLLTQQRAMINRETNQQKQARIREQYYSGEIVDAEFEIIK